MYRPWKAIRFFVSTSPFVKRFLTPLILVNVVCVVVLSVLSIFFEYEELYSKLSFSETIEYQLAVIIAILVFEILLVLIFVFRLYRNDSKNGNGIESLLATGESEQIEFKSSLRWDYATQQLNKDLEHTILKTISAFLNSNGGTLLIGVDDTRTVIGLKPDYETLKKKNSDGFLLHLNQIINTHLGKEIQHFVHSSIVVHQEKEICKVIVLASDTPVYVNYSNQEEFFIRASNSSQPMSIKEAHEYIRMHWKK